MLTGVSLCPQAVRFRSLQPGRRLPPYMALFLQAWAGSPVFISQKNCIVNFYVCLCKYDYSSCTITAKHCSLFMLYARVYYWFNLKGEELESYHYKIFPRYIFTVILQFPGNHVLSYFSKIHLAFLFLGDIFNRIS